MWLCRVQTELTSEEKRHSHQKELAEKLNQEARARLAGQKEKTDEKKYACRVICVIKLFIAAFCYFTGFLPRILESPGNFSL